MPRAMKPKVSIEDSTPSLRCARCSDGITDSSHLLSIYDDTELECGFFHLCPSCSSSMPAGVRDGRPDIVLEWLSSDSIQPFLTEHYKVSTWDICQKLEYTMGSTQYCKALVRIAREPDPGPALIKLWQSIRVGVVHA